MAAARQKEMKVSITVVATKTFTAGFDPSTDVAMLGRSAFQRYEISLEDSTGDPVTCLFVARSTCQCGPRAYRAAECPRPASHRGTCADQTSAPIVSARVPGVRGT